MAVKVVRKPRPLGKTRALSSTSFGHIRGFEQFRANMKELAKLGDQNTLKQGFVDIASDIKRDMNRKLESKIAPARLSYVRWKVKRFYKRKTTWRPLTSLRQRGIVGKGFASKGASLAMVAIDYRYAPHAHWLEEGTKPRQHKSGHRTGLVPRKKFEYFHNTLSRWRTGGDNSRYCVRVADAVDKSLKAMTRKMTV